MSENRVKKMQNAYYLYIFPVCFVTNLRSFY